ncbi:MAG: TonB-dependent receptor [Bryobacterales bacterium]
MRISKFALHAAMVLLSLPALLAPRAVAQTAGGTVLGSVRDQQGASIPAAAVVVTNVATGISRDLVTNENGAYRAVNLQPGPYDVVFQSNGFATAVRRNINLTVGAEIVVDVEMQLASVSETVEVVAAEAVVDLSTATVSRNVGGTTIRELPLNGRDWTQLATLQPGTASIGSGGGGSRGGSGVKLTVSGARPTENNFRLDGISVNDASNTTPASILGTNLGVEAVREFSLVSSNYSAEYGRATGGVVNAVTKSGTNELHGTVFYFHRNSALDARDFFDVEKPTFRRHQYGAAVGGPVAKNKTFWFMNYEGLEEALPTTSVATTLTANARQGILSTGDVTVDPAVARFIELMPLPNGRLLGAGDTAQFVGPTDKLSSGKYILGKMDHTFSAQDSLSGSYFFDDADSTSTDVYRTKEEALTSRRQGASLEYTRVISPTLLNVARIGFSRRAMDTDAISQVFNPLLEDPSLGFVPGLNIGATSVAGLTVPGGGPGANNEAFYNFASYQIHENLYITKGIHALKVGVSVERMHYNFDSPNRSGGDFGFGSIAEFLTNQPTTFSALYPGSDTRRGLRQTLFGGYVQDDIRLRNNLTVNLGLRYEFATIPTEVNGKIALLHDLFDSEVTVGGPVHDRNPTRKNFSPRIGVVWDPFGDGKTSIRSSFGIFDSLPLVWLYDTPLTRSLPTFLQGVTLSPSAGSFPGGAFNEMQIDTLRTAYIEPDPGRSYSTKWTFNIQREISGWIAEIGYSGSRGVHLPLVERNMNTVLPTETPEGVIYPEDGVVLNPNFASINTTDTWNADSYYHGLQTSVRRTLGSGMQVMGSYTWSKSVDTASSTGSTSSTSGYSSSVAVPHPLFPHLNRGLSDFDLRHNFVFSLVWELPFGQSKTGLVRTLLSGWQLGTIYRAQTGTPFSPVLNNDQAGSKADTRGGALGQRPNLLLGPGCEGELTNSGNPNGYIKTECFGFPAQYTLGNLGRNTLTVPGLSNLDFSLFKNIRFNERFTSQLRFEFFNAFNHTNFDDPETVIFDRQGRNPSDAGLITSTRTPGRRIQVGLKLHF